MRGRGGDEDDVTIAPTISSAKVSWRLMQRSSPDGTAGRAEEGDPAR
jgi:hypothetical protein